MSKMDLKNVHLFIFFRFNVVGRKEFNRTLSMGRIRQPSFHIITVRRIKIDTDNLTWPKEAANVGKDPRNTSSM